VGNGIFDSDFSKGFLGGYFGTKLIGRNWGKNNNQNPNTDPKIQEILNSFLDDFYTRCNNYNDLVETHLESLTSKTGKNLEENIKEIDSLIDAIFTETKKFTHLVDSGDYWKAINIAAEPKGAFKKFEALCSSSAYQEFNTVFDKYLNDINISEKLSSKYESEKDKAIEQLERLTKLKESGGITEEEFTVLKAKLMPKLM